MQSLKPYRNPETGVDDLLNWAALIDNGIVQGKDGTLIAGFFYQGPDVASSTDGERNYIAAQANQALSRLGSGWATWSEAVRLPVVSYSPREASHFPDPITALIDQERREQFMTTGHHFESHYLLIVTYTPPLRHNSQVVDLMYQNHTQDEAQIGDRLLAQFKKALDELEDTLSCVITLERMGSYTYTDSTGRGHLRDELIHFLHFALTGLSHPINIPPIAMYTNHYLGGQELWVGDCPRIGENHICCLSIDGFPAESYPNMLECLQNLPVAYRWSTRMLYLDEHESVGILQKLKSKWKQKSRGFLSQVFKTSDGANVNEDALFMATQADSAIQEARSNLVTFGIYTSVIVLMGPDVKTLKTQARLIAREIQREGFACRIETQNTVEAWLGTLPGHVHPNVRRSIIHTGNLADITPYSSTWAGVAQCPCPIFPSGSPALMVAATHGATPFRLNLHVGDVGHSLVFGPTGAGKSTLLAMIMAQFRRYPQASVFAFDKGQSLWMLTQAVGGLHLDFSSTRTPHLAPLAILETQTDVTWAEEWLAISFELQSGHAPTPKQREAVHKALTLFRDNESCEHRSLTDFLATVQDLEIRSALSYYTLSGTLGYLLDNPVDTLQENPFTVIEVEELLGMGEKSAIPILLLLFRRFEKSLRGQPALLVLDEAWIMLGHPVFREKVREWLKTLRKANCAVILATQSLSDAVHSQIFDVLVESCPTKILLPNDEADKGGTDTHLGPRDFYSILGLNERQIQILKNATKKRDYYYVSPEGRRLFSLNLGEIALAFTAVSDRATRREIERCMEQHGPQWPYHWLKEKGISYEEYLEQSHS